jgi:hypothetical protein
MKVYTVTVIDFIGDPVLGHRSTPAIFTSLEQAITTVKNNEQDIADDNLYQYAVIEETYLDIIRPDLEVTTKKWWFKYNTVLDEFEECETSRLPFNIANLSGFGIG